MLRLETSKGRLWLRSFPAPARALLWICALLFSGTWGHAHIGDQNVLFEGQAGAYPVRVVIRPPGVIPGLAEVSVRVNTNGNHLVSVLPMRWNTGRQGAPRPDVAQPVRGESNLFSAELWFMKDGAQGVEVEVQGLAGSGRVIVPVNAVATRVLGMSKTLGQILGVLGVLLVALAVSIAGSAVRDSVLPAGGLPTTRRRWLARGTSVVAGLAVGGAIWFGKKWWDAEAHDYRNNRLYEPVAASARLRAENGQSILTLKRTADSSRRHGPLVPEHGKLMHLFLIREPLLDAFAHLHPVKLAWNTFETPLPELPAGDYQLYADVTYEAGFAETLTARLSIPESAVPGPDSTAALDSDDGWRLTEPFTGGKPALRQTNAVAGYSIELSLESALVENRDTTLRVVVRDALRRPAMLQHYMGMAGHLIVRRDDGAVFTHLHPSGTFSMTAQQLFELRAEGKAPLRVAPATGEPICRLPGEDPKAAAMTHEQISFPYAFPKAGAYRLWVQVKVGGRPLTGYFDVSVAEAAGSR